MDARPCIDTADPRIFSPLHTMEEEHESIEQGEGLHAASSSAGEVVLRRPCCGTLLCVACDQYLQTLHNCPGCLSADA